MEIHNIKEGELENLLLKLDKCKELKISGIINNYDIDRLTTFIEKKNVEILDLSKSKIKENRIGNHAFLECTSIKEIKLPEIREIGQNAFSKCENLKEIHLQEGISKIEDYAFWSCHSLQKITMPKSIAEIGINAFAGCSDLKEIQIPEGVKKINDYTFLNCTELKKVQISQSVTSIGECAFAGCENLQEANIPKGVTAIGERAFWACDKLKLNIEKENNNNDNKNKTMNIDFNKYKKDISLPDFLIEHFEFAPVQGSSMKFPKLKSKITGDTLVIKKNSQGHYTYFDIHDDNVRGKSILDFVQKELGDKDPSGRQPSLTQVAKTLDGYITSGKIVAPDESKYYLDATSWNKDSILREILSLKPIVANEFLQSRGFSAKTLENPLFNGAFYEKTYNKDGVVHTNTAIKLYNHDGVTGISQRNNSFKGSLGNRFDALATSIPVKDKEYDIYFIGESFLDCMAHYELNEKKLRDKTVGYLSSEGAITNGQIALFNKLVNEKKPKEIVTLFDRDIAGLIFTLKINAQLYIEGKTLPIVVTSQDDEKNKTVYLDFSFPKEGDKELNLESLFNKDKFAEISEQPIEIHQIIKDEKMTSYQLAIPRQYDMLEKAIEKIQELRFGETLNISFEKPITKDFNDDLKASKGKHPDWQITEINGIKRAKYKGTLLPLEENTKIDNTLKL